MNSTHVTSPPCPDRVANTPRSVGDCPKRQMTAWTKGKLTCESQRATDFPEPNATREELEAATERLNLLTEAEIYSTDAVMTMVRSGRNKFASTSNVTRSYSFLLVDDHPGHWCRRPPFTTPHSPSLRQSISKTHSQSCRTSRLSSASERGPWKENPLSRRKVRPTPLSIRVQCTNRSVDGQSRKPCTRPCTLL